MRINIVTRKFKLVLILLEVALAIISVDGALYEKGLNLTTDFEIEILIYVPVDYKMKILKTQKIYIDMDSETVPLRLIPRIDSQSKNSTTRIKIFLFI